MAGPFAQTDPAFARALERACPSALRARGRAWAEEGRVRFVRRDDDAYEFRVADPSGRAHDVVLFPEDAEWSCDCDGRFEACEHVAAAAFAPAEATPVDAATEPDRPVALAYELRRVDRGLALRRHVVLADGSRRVAARADFDRLLATTAADDAVARALAGHPPGRLRTPTLARVLEALRGAEDVRLDGVPVRIGAPHPGLYVVVRDEGEGVLVRLVRDRKVEETFDGGAILRDGTLHSLAAVDLPRDRRKALAEGIFVARDELGRLAAEVLPDLRRRVPVRVRTTRLPKAETARPRLDVRVERLAGGFRAAVRVVYGDPPVAEVTEDGAFSVVVDDAPVPIRRPDEEARLFARARAALDLPQTGTIVASFDEAPEAAGRIAEALSALGVSPDPVLEDFYDAGPLEVRIEAGDLAFVRAGRHADPNAVLAAYAAGRRCVPLEGGGLARLPHDFLDAHAHLVEAFLRARKAGEKAARSVAQACLAVATGDVADVPAALVALAEGRLPEGAAAPLPPLSATLRPYQEEGVAFLASRKALGIGALLADDMGLGKTVQTLAVLEGRCMVVAPTSVLGSWEEQAARFRPDLRVQRYHGADRRLDPEADLVITSWGVLRRDVDLLAGETFDVVVLDESHTIKNPDSQVARAALRLDGRFRVALSGTPVENRPEDLWAQLSFLVPGLFGDLETFRTRYVTTGAEGRARLERLLRPLVLRRTKEEVARDLPPRTDLRHDIELSDAERRFYGAIVAAARADVERLGSGATSLAILEALLRVRQAACDPALVPGAPAPLVEATSSKLAYLGELLEELLDEGHKVLVFSQWTGLLDRVERIVQRIGAPHTRLDGSTRDRDGVVAAFQAEDGPPVMLVSLKAGGVGLTLTRADHVVLLDPWWNPAVEEQAAGRAHRIGQERPVFVHRLIARGTVEEGVLALAEQKRAMVADLLGEGGKALDAETAMELLNSA